MSGLLVVGASGLVGAELLAAANARALQVTGAARRVRFGATLSVDLADPASIDRVLARVQPDRVAVCSAWPHVDGCEDDPDRSWRENVETVKNLVRGLGERSRVPLLFFSTDHVFDGERDGYVESDPVHPLSVYARHKRAVEELLLERGDALIARTAWVFGTEAQRKNFVYRVLDAAAQGQPLRVPARQAGCPTWARWLCGSSLDLWSGGMRGIVHLAGPWLLTKAEWAQRVGEALGLTGLEVQEVPWSEAGQRAPRPERVLLRSERHPLQHPPLAEILEAEFKGE